MDRLLQIGDVFELKRGMRVYAKLPEKYFISNKKLSNEFIEKDITIGDILQPQRIEESDLKDIVNDIIHDFDFRLGIRIQDDKVISYVMDIINNHRISDGEYDTSELCGKYIVTFTSVTGGGYGHGYNDVYPDGYQVVAQNIEDSEQTIRFFQTGCFTAMILQEDIELYEYL